MKLKIDFVTNSSSAGFMLMVKIDGYMPQLDMPNLLKYFKSLEYDVKTSRSAFVDPWQKTLLFRVNAHEDDEVDQLPKYKLDIEKISIIEGNDENQEEQEKSRISLVGTNVNFCNKDSLEYTKDVSAIIIQNLIHTYKTPISKNDFQFLVRIEPTDFWGDGWNGDAMGPYQQIHDAIRAETKFGSLILNDNNMLEYRLYDLNGKLVVKGPPGI